VIVVDSSVWIDFLNGRKAAHVERLQAALGAEEIVVGDLMLCEVLQGLASERAAREVESLLRRFAIVPMAGDAIAVAAARYFRYLRRRGIAVRKTIHMWSPRGVSKIEFRCSTTTVISILWRVILD
jgi:predicted nucleic acid-binding protein